MPIHTDDQSWVSRALCAQYEPDTLFVQGASQRQVRLRCMECEVRLECLADALQSEANYGVWGGLTERERRAILRHYSDITNWAEWINESDDPLAEEIRSPQVPRVLAHVRH
ncbi:MULTISPECIES: WhiB family transcriptional regulator [unclassified Schaalia]|uniref:WhiB family transcriptional regulator n=1 Tax=unclassified Schaalia TaxID=2691889 RepID=UPI001E284ED6|nr:MULTISPECIES: WhiB family transcriptional regulator [unclassified Schaalia]MCD4548827.1 WhiB family transcriptional regulator [Schaalia sp. lx-260]MCD4557443.1 WhiB family transcriptional regulator [Schaalia sp. lx-100]